MPIRREEILRCLRSTIASGHPVLGAGASIGIIAKCADIGGADLILVYSTGRSRMRGWRTTMEPESNRATLAMVEEIGDVVERTPIVVGLDACEPPAEEDLEGLIRPYLDRGASGVINFPTYGFANDPEWRRQEEAKGKGFAREVELIGTARRMGVFTMAYVFWPDDARAMARAEVDCMVPHVGGTAGGLAGYPSVDLPTAAARVEEMIRATREVDPRIICLGHGGPFATPEDTRYLYEHTSAGGFVGASAIERIPIEEAVTRVVRAFKETPLSRDP